MKITIDKQKCIGCGSCSAVCPDLFELNEEHKAQAKKEEIESEEEKKCAQEATDICPVQAIKVEK